MDFLHKLLGKAIQVDRGVVSQLNPFDHGATYKTIVNPKIPIKPPVKPRPYMTQLPKTGTINFMTGQIQDLPVNQVATPDKVGTRFMPFNTALYGTGKTYLYMPYDINSLPQPKPYISPIRRRY